MPSDLNKLTALIQHMKLNTSGIGNGILADEESFIEELMFGLEIEQDAENVWIVSDQKYLILDEIQAENEFKARLNHYKDNESKLASYRDNDKLLAYFRANKDLKSDANNRGKFLSSYDGIEHKEIVNGEIYHLYRQYHF